MNKKSNIRILSGCLATIVLLLCTLGYLSRVFERKASRNRFQEFYEQQQNFDVLLLGSSHVLNGISPMDMWEQNGIVAYNMGAAGCRIASSYWMLENALQYTTPQLVVLDCAYLLDRKANDNINYMHTIFDSMPLSKVKIEAILDLYDQEKDIARFLFPFSLYHNRWNELTRDDWFYKPVYGKMGMTASCDVTDAILPDFSVAEINEVDNISTQYLFKIFSLCKQRKIDILLTFIPFNLSEQSKNDAAYIQQIAAQNNIRYLGPEDLVAYINTSTDFMNNYDDNSHLNISGAHKLSYYLGSYISKNYSIPDHRQDPMYNDWHQYYDLYQSYKLSLLKEQENLNNYLVGMADKNYAYVIYFNNTEWFQDEMVVNLLENLNIDIGEEVEKETCLLTQASTAALMETACIQINGEGRPVLLTQGEIQHCWDATVADADVYILVMDNSCMNVLDSASFSLATHERIS